jgi:hypothetical protein
MLDERPQLLNMHCAAGEMCLVQNETSRTAFCYVVKILANFLLGYANFKIILHFPIPIGCFGGLEQPGHYFSRCPFTQAIGCLPGMQALKGSFKIGFLPDYPEYVLIGTTSWLLPAIL